jgi:hydroxymethylpyrimidine/phosphomethylpyrimidine kinase
VKGPHLLVVAGDDPSGGAGLRIDAATAQDFGFEVHGVLSARTDQDASEVRAVGAVAVDEWFPAARAALEEDPIALKFGLLPSAAALRAAAELARLSAAERPLRPVVVDPVIRSSSGHRFLAPEDVRLYADVIAATGVWITPNLPEIAELVGAELEALRDDPELRKAAARSLLELGAAGVVLKDGHGLGAWTRDLVLDSAGATYWIEFPRLEGQSIRGSGCRHATALACALARGESAPAAAHTAAAYVSAAIGSASKS